MNPKIKVLGVGGSGSNTISRIAKFNVQGIELIAVNTDAQALHFCKVPKKILIGKNITKGLGAGADVNLGKKAAEENRKEIIEFLNGADMVFITCGLGGGTGSGAAPVIAESAKNLGILTIAVVTTPFSFEGEQRKKVAVEYNTLLELIRANIDEVSAPEKLNEIVTWAKGLEKIWDSQLQAAHMIKAKAETLGCVLNKEKIYEIAVKAEPVA